MQPYSVTKSLKLFSPGSEVLSSPQIIASKCTTDLMEQHFAALYQCQLIFIRLRLGSHGESSELTNSTRIVQKQSCYTRANQTTIGGLRARSAQIHFLVTTVLTKIISTIG